MNDQPKRTQFFGGCPHDCPDTCAMIYEVEGGRLVEVRGNKEHPMTRGGLCVKLKDYHDHHYNPDRVLYPLRRVGPKGSRQFARISWDEAIAEITKRWKDIIARYGSQAIMPYSYLGNEGLVQGLTAGDAFFNRLGSTVNEKTFCASGSSTAWLLTVGPTGGVDPESFVHSRYIVIWACNSISTNLHHWPFVLEAQKRGAKIVVIDSYRSRTAKQADWHIMPKPGTDGALAMGIMAAMIRNGHVDREWVEKHTVGFAELAERAAEFTPDYVEEVTGVPAQDVATFAREFATIQPSVIRLGVALERHAGGGQTIRAVCSIPALAGSWRHVGGGLLQMPLWEFPIDWARVSRPDFIRPGTRVVNNLQLGRALVGDMKLDPPIMGLYIYNTNPVSQAPETNTIVRGLSREDLFFVTAEHFVTDTAAYADIVLPATMAGEHDDMMFSWGHFYLTINEQAIAPCGEAKSNAEIFRLLAAAFGFDDPQFKMSDMELAEHYVKWDAPQMAGIDLEYFRRHGYFHLAVGTPDDRLPHAERQLPHALGQGGIPGQGRQELRRAAVPHDVRGDAVGRGCRSASRLRAAAGERRHQPAPRRALSAQRHFAQEPRLPQFLLRQRAAQDQRAGRAIRHDQPERRGRAQHPRRRSGQGLQRSRRLRGPCPHHRRRARRRDRGDARLLAEPQPLRRLGEFDLIGRVLRARAGADFLRQSGPGRPRQLTATLEARVQ